RIRKGDEWKTAFITPSGHYEYRVMPYGLSIAPAVFQGFMNEVLRPFLQRYIMVYIDDILIYSRNLEEHHHHVREVLGALRSQQLYLNLSKCEFHREEVQFLGYIISARGIQMNDRKVNAVRNWPVPGTIKELQRFLGFANFYRRFIQGYNQITAPLTSLLRGKARTLRWTKEAQGAFEELRQRFCSAPVLRHPDPWRPFVVEVDASSTGVGAALSQRSGTPPQLHPCAFFSHKLSAAEQNYDIGNSELLAIMLALDEWRHWLEGAEHPFTVVTDHKNLQYLWEARRLNARQARWALFFTRFQFHVTYRAGTLNGKADALSRMFGPEEPRHPDPILPPSIVVGPIVWDMDSEIHAASIQEPAPGGCPEGRVFVPTSCRGGLIQSVHEGPGTGHPGERRTVQLLQARYWWPRMAEEVTHYVQECSTCAMAKVPRHLPVGKLVPLPVPRRPWSHLGIDFLTDLPRSGGNTCILVAVD
ncbi:MAG: RNase H-like domain-containing protein, partial [Cetobacterium sp.]